MSTWSELVATAVVGTERRSLPPAVASDVAAVLGDGALEGAPTGGAEDRVLVAAGVLGAWRRAGAVPTAGTGPLPDPAPGDLRPPASPRAVQLLELLLEGHTAARGTSTDLLADWLARCEASGRRPPAGLLPRILEAATAPAAAALRRPAVAAGGPPLRWLAARNPAWAWAAEAAGPGADPARVWEEGTREARLALLASLRANDPPRARALLAGTWHREAAADRARFVEALATGLGPDDEPFLEAALDDRARTVRAAAASLLAALPTSALSGRMAARLRPLVSVDRHATRLGRRRKRLRVAVPEQVDAGAARDGITPDGAPAGVGRRAWALIQIIGATPLSFWEDALEAGPEEIVALGAGEPEVVAGWVRAAARQRDPDWARPLLRHRTDGSLLGVLPPRILHDELPAVLDRTDDAAVVPLLAHVPAPWPPATSHAVLTRIRSAEHRHAVRSALPVLATALDPAVGPDVERWAGSLRDDDPLRGPLRSLGQTLSLRDAIAQEFG